MESIHDFRIAKAGTVLRRKRKIQVRPEDGRQSMFYSHAGRPNPPENLQMLLLPGLAPDKRVVTMVEKKKIGTIYAGKSETLGIKFNRVWAMPNHETFKIGPIRQLLRRYVKRKGFNWIDPFAGANSPAVITNDHNAEMPTSHHMEAIEFIKSLKPGYGFAGIIFDPPYSFTQIKEHYELIGKQKKYGWTNNMRFYESVKSAACDKIKPGGYAISFGWNTNGFGKARGFKIVEILMIAHGGSKNDTICTVEQKIA